MLGLVVLSVLIVLLVSAVAYLRGRYAPVGSVARIHIDDLALGRGPDVCAVTGVPSQHRVEVSSREGGFSPWWLLLVFLGPIGWVGLALLLALARRPGRVSGVLTICPEALDRYNAMVRLSTRSMATAMVSLLGGVFGLLVLQRAGVETATLAAIGIFAVVAVSVVVALGASIAAPYRWIDLELDGSGRWVTVRRVHPTYAAAMHAFSVESGTSARP